MKNNISENNTSKYNTSENNTSENNTPKYNAQSTTHREQHTGNNTSKKHPKNCKCIVI